MKRKKRIYRRLVNLVLTKMNKEIFRIKIKIRILDNQVNTLTDDLLS